jgi:hypothetical protein
LCNGLAETLEADRMKFGVNLVVDFCVWVSRLLAQDPLHSM